MDDFFEPDDPTAEVEMEPEAPARRKPPAKSRRPMDPEERRRLLIRRGIALGVGLVLLLLIALGIKGCLDARKNRSLESYASNVTQLTDETNALGQSMFEMLDDPGDLSVTEFTDQVETDRNAMDGFLSRVEKLSVPDDMKAAQQDLLLTYQLRSSAMGEIATAMPTALGDEGSEKAVQGIAAQIQVLTAADVIYNRVARHKVDAEIVSAGASSPELPRSTFVPNPSFWSDPANVEEALAGVSGGTREPDDDAIHGTGIESVAIGGVALDPSVSNTVPAGTDPTIEVSVQNQGGAEETDVTVSVSVDGGTSVEETIPTIGIGETQVASLTLDSVLSGEVTIDVSVAPVPGESLTDNNEDSYTVTFE
jgi:hypothetical protein